MHTVALKREPEPMGTFVDHEALRFLELHHSKQTPQRFAIECDIGRTIFYQHAVGEYVDYVRGHELTPELMAKKKAEIQERIDAGEEGQKDFPKASLPLREGYFLIGMDRSRLYQAMGITVLYETTLKRVLWESALHYFQSRGDA